jgi:hypothetical protein
LGRLGAGLLGDTTSQKSEEKGKGEALHDSQFIVIGGLGVFRWAK